MCLRSRIQIWRDRIDLPWIPGGGFVLANNAPGERSGRASRGHPLAAIWTGRLGPRAATSLALEAPGDDPADAVAARGKAVLARPLVRTLDSRIVSVDALLAAGLAKLRMVDHVIEVIEVLFASHGWPHAATR
jgi:hypothetical protein